ncbi:MAG: serine/threonine protein kinase [Planctomycetia bacterium]|nr:serine/threonine protein kinase [Planctomycetia bacterium]
MQPTQIIESRIEAFEAAWRQGVVPGIADYLSADPPLGPDDAQRLLLELIAVDLEYRWREGPGEIQADSSADDGLRVRPTLHRYAAEFDQLGTVDRLPTWLMAEEYRVRQLWGDRPSHDQFFANYPRHFAALIPLLRRIDLELAADGAVAAAVRPPRFAAAPDPRAPLPFADYVLEQHLGTGGMGKVYRALQRSLGRQVAIKALLKSRQDDALAVEQFLQEGRIVGQLRHPNIVGVHGLGRFPSGGYFLAMDWIEGHDLATALQAGPAAIAEAVRITADVARAVEHAHQHGVIHCDLKPANVLLDRTGHVFVTDFGLARLIGSGRLAGATGDASHDVGGTPAFMAPELLEAEAPEPAVAVDIYGIGGILYALLTGHAPFVMPVELAGPVADTDNLLSRLRAAMPVPPPTTWRADIPAPLAAVCGKCLSENPAERYATAEEVVQALLG